MSIMNMAIPEDEGERSLITIYGNPGSGKTVLASRLGNRSALLTNENGWKVLRNNHPDLYATVTPIKFTGLNSIAEVVRAIKKDAEDYDQLILDTISGMQQAKIQENLKSVKLNRFHEEIPSEQDYLLSQKQWTPIIAALATCGINVTLLCHLRTPNPNRPIAGETTRPDLTKAVFNLVNQYSQVVAYLRKDGRGTKRLVTTQGTGSLTAKDQTNIESAEMSDDDFVEAIRKSRGL
jgi:phage nucleotide-binding protein